MSENKFGRNVRTYRDVLIRDSEIGDNVLIADDSFITGCKIDENVIVERRNMLFDSHLGAYSGTGYNDVIKNAEIGKFCSLSWNCTIGGDEHFLHRLSTSFFPLHPRSGFTDEMMSDIEQSVAKPLTIGHDVWIAAGVQIMRGVSVGCGAVLGGGTIVTKNVPPYEIWAGVPAKKIGQRFSDEIIADLMEIKWWDLPVQVIKDNIDLFRKDVDLEYIIDIKQMLGNY